MSRIARAVAVDFPHHIVQRGNNKESVFFDKADRKTYLELLRKYSENWYSPVMAYCLMTNHIHLLTRPRDVISLAKMMQGVTLCYTQYINRKYQRTGRLWESRYHSCIVDQARYLWAVARYIEQNPQRARMVTQPEDYAYSSARAHIKGVRDKVIGGVLFGEEKQGAYREFLKKRDEEETKSIRYNTKTGRPLGNERFIKKMEKKLGRKFRTRSRGRPRKGNK